MKLNNSFLLHLKTSSDESSWSGFLIESTCLKLEYFRLTALESRRPVVYEIFSITRVSISAKVLTASLKIWVSKVQNFGNFLTFTHVVIKILVNSGLRCLTTSGVVVVTVISEWEYVIMLRRPRQACTTLPQSTSSGWNATFVPTILKFRQIQRYLTLVLLNPIRSHSHSFTSPTLPKFTGEA